MRNGSKSSKKQRRFQNHRRLKRALIAERRVIRSQNVGRSIQNFVPKIGERRHHDGTYCARTIARKSSLFIIAMSIRLAQTISARMKKSPDGMERLDERLEVITADGVIFRTHRSTAKCMSKQAIIMSPTGSFSATSLHRKSKSQISSQYPAYTTMVRNSQ